MGAVRLASVAAVLASVAYTLAAASSWVHGSDTGSSTLGALVLFTGSVVAGHTATCFFVAAGSVATHSVCVFGKRTDGTLAWWATVFWWPWRALLLYAVLPSARKRARTLFTRVGSIRGRDVFVGGYPGGPGLPPGDRAWLAQQDTATVLDMTSELPRGAQVPVNATYACAPTPDGRAPRPADIERLCNVALQGKGCVLVHCAFGIGRSASVACAVLVAGGAFQTWEEALAAVQKRRSIVRLNVAQRAELVAWAARRY